MIAKILEYIFATWCVIGCMLTGYILITAIIEYFDINR